MSFCRVAIPIAGVAGRTGEPMSPQMREHVRRPSVTVASGVVADAAFVPVSISILNLKQNRTVYLHASLVGGGDGDSRLL